MMITTRLNFIKVLFFSSIVLTGCLPIFSAPGATLEPTAEITIPPAPPIDPQETPQPTIQPTEEPVLEGWTSYASDQYGFTFDHPADLEVVLREFDNPPLARFAVGDQIEIRINEFDPLACRGDCPVVEKTLQAEINGLPATRIEGYIGAIGGNIPQQYVTYFLPRGERFFAITLYALGFGGQSDDLATIRPLNEDDVAMFEELLATVSFTNSAESEPTQDAAVELTGTPAAGEQPPSTCAATPADWVAYTVQPGDTLFGIAMRVGSTVDQLAAASCLADANVLDVGQVIFVPPAGQNSTPAAPTPAGSGNAEGAPKILTFEVDQVDLSNDAKQLTFRWETVGADDILISVWTSVRHYPTWQVEASGEMTVEVYKTNWPNPQASLHVTNQDSTESIHQSVEVKWPCLYTYFIEIAIENCPSGSPQTFATIYQEFEKGIMIAIPPTDPVGPFIYALTDEGRAYVQPDPWTVDQPEIDPSLQPPDGLFAPARGFGQIWQPSEQIIQADFGWATAETMSYSAILQSPATSILPGTQFLTLPDGSVAKISGGYWEIISENVAVAGDLGED